MSRAKSRNVDVCADCGASEPTWASLNRGILLCVQCCSVHRSLGRRISHVKSLTKSNLNPAQITMLHTLHNNGANNIWEHTLLENGSKLNKRKPTAKDMINVKSEFIKAKHERLEFAFRPNNEDGLICVENELGKQLHASVRTSNLDTSFRFLIQGADPNYFHDEKGTTPLHVAVKANQKEQVELLLIHGADPTCPDVTGLTAVDYAKNFAHKDLYNRLVESQYEVTDQFTYFLNFRKPDHSNGIHMIIPQVNNNGNLCISKLRKLSNHVFEELVADVYEEVERRLIETIWTSNMESLQLNIVPFLPVDQELSTTRNQSRQKLGRFSTPELKTLIQDILIDIARRQDIDKGDAKLRSSSIISDDDPLYDSVASDDDYALTNDHEETKDTTDNIVTDENQNPTMMPVSPIEPPAVEYPSNSTIDMLTKQLLESHETILDLKNEVNNLKALVEHLSSENFELKSKLSQTKLNKTDQDQDSMLDNKIKDVGVGDMDVLPIKKVQRPSSMYETRERIKVPNWQAMKNAMPKNDRNTIQGCPAQAVQSQEIIAFTEHVTKCIQDLWSVIQGAGRENCVPYAGKIRNAVMNLTEALPSENNGDVVKHIQDCVHYLHVNCMGLQTAYKSGDLPQIESYMQKVRKCAFEIAKDTKQLVTKYTSQ